MLTKFSSPKQDLSLPFSTSSKTIFFSEILTSSIVQKIRFGITRDGFFQRIFARSSYESALFPRFWVKLQRLLYMVRKNLNEIVFSYFHIIIDHLYVIKIFLFQLLERCIETNLVLFWRFCSASRKAFFEFIDRWWQEKNCFYLVSFFLQNWLNVDHPLWFDDVERIFIFTQNAIQFRKS